MLRKSSNACVSAPAGGVLCGRGHRAGRGGQGVQHARHAVDQADRVRAGALQNQRSVQHWDVGPFKTRGQFSTGVFGPSEPEVSSALGCSALQNQRSVQHWGVRPFRTRGQFSTGMLGPSKPDGSSVLGCRALQTQREVSPRVRVTQTRMMNSQQQPNTRNWQNISYTKASVCLLHLRLWENKLWFLQHVPPFPTRKDPSCLTRP